jgi:hypothetical protein
MQKQALPETVDGVDYMAQAATTLNGASNALSGLDF